jgi:hypothetical protein
MTLTEMTRFYGKSAGGTGFDLSETGLTWIQYVKIVKTGAIPEIDAVSDAAPRIPGDANCDGIVNDLDNQTLQTHLGQYGSWSWGDFTGDGMVSSDDYQILLQYYNSSPDIRDTIPGDVNLDNKVDAVDLSILTQNWNASPNAAYVMGDLDGNGTINENDLQILKENWGNER